MARNKSAKDVLPSRNGSSVANSQPQWGGFIELRLREDERAEFDNWFELNSTSVWGYVVTSVEEGRKFGLSYDADGDFYLATFTAHGKETIGLQDRYCLTARAPVAEQAMALLCYKHYVMLEGDWGRVGGKSQRVERFG